MIDPNINVESLLNKAVTNLGFDYVLQILTRRPTTVVIYNVSTSGAGWQAIASGLEGVLAWKLTEKSGNAFRYCFDGVGTTYVTSYGAIQRDTAITAIYVQRTAATDIDLELEIWTA